MENKIFAKFYADKSIGAFRDFIQDLVKHPLFWAVYFEGVARTRRIKKTSPEGLEQGEFFLSQTETDVFGLKKSQKGQIERVVKKLIFKKYFQKTGKRIGSEQSVVYRLGTSQIIEAFYETGNETGYEQVTNRERTDTKGEQEEEKELASNAVKDFLKSEHVQKSDIPQTLDVHGGGDVPSQNQPDGNILPSPILQYVYQQILPHRKGISNKEAYSKKIAATLAKKILANKEILLNPSQDNWKGTAFKIRHILKDGKKPAEWDEADWLFWAITENGGFEYLEAMGVDL